MQVHIAKTGERERERRGREEERKRGRGRGREEEEEEEGKEREEGMIYVRPALWLGLRRPMTPRPALVLRSRHLPGSSASGTALRQTPRPGARPPIAARRWRREPVS